MKKVEQHDWLYLLLRGVKEFQRTLKMQRSLPPRARGFSRDIRTQRKKMILNQWKKNNFLDKRLASRVVVVLAQQPRVRSTWLTLTATE
jgi:hypothetical protein